MWMLNNRTPYAAERNWVLDKNAAKSWVVAVKATFDILPDGTTKLAEKQEEPLYGEEYSGEPGESSVLYDADLIGPKQKTDVILNGHAYAPGGKPVTEITVTMKVHKITKQLRVVGDRRWERGVLGLSMTPPEPFEKMPLIYERAFGGWDTQAGEVGRPAARAAQPHRGRVRRRRRASRRPAPAQRRRPEATSSPPGGTGPPPAGFGVVASYWMPRLKFAGTYDEKWQKERFPLLPEDFDERFFQSAPEDQQVAGLPARRRAGGVDEPVPGGSKFDLPRVYPAS